MSIHEILGLEAVDETSWRLTLNPNVTTSMGALQGGAGLAAAVEAMVATSGRPLVWATAQYLTFVQTPAVVDIDVSMEVVGHQLTQARATLRYDGDEILTAHGALGRRDPKWDRAYEPAPEVADPDDCEPRRLMRPDPGVIERWDPRVASGRQFDLLDGSPGVGRTASWYRVMGGPRPLTAGDLDVVADLAMFALSDAVGERVTGNSLDNTVRVVDLSPTEWILLDTSVDAISDGFGTLVSRLWSLDRTLLGTASQSIIVRGVTPEGRNAQTHRRLAGA